VGLRAQAGWAKEFHWVKGDNDEVPIEDRFFAGGARSVRGYQERILGPRLEGEEVIDPTFFAPAKGGQAQLLLNAEIRVPLAWGFGMTLFFDGGNVWESWDEVRIDQFFPIKQPPKGEERGVLLDFRTSWGVGIHYNTIVGPLRLEHGWPLKPEGINDEDGIVVEAKDKPIWHFSLGHAF
jgi:outer membrane protein insertion porin family